MCIRDSPENVTLVRESPDILHPGRCPTVMFVATYGTAERCQTHSFGNTHRALSCRSPDQPQGIILPYTWSLHTEKFDSNSLHISNMCSNIIDSIFCLLYTSIIVCLIRSSFVLFIIFFILVLSLKDTSFQLSRRFKSKTSLPRRSVVYTSIPTTYRSIHMLGGNGNNANHK